jgi:glycosyltransferase involved in cell wall biosynthesis
VLQVVLSLNPGGTERLVLDLVNRLHPEIPMAVCCIDQRGSWAGPLEAAGIRVTAVERGPGFRPGVGRSIGAAAQQHRATVVHAHHYSPFVYSALAGRLPVVYTEHGRVSDAPPSRRRYWANRVFFARRAARVFAVSRELGDHLVAEGFHSSRVAVIPNGIPLPAARSPDGRARLRRELGAGDDTLVIGTIARLDPVKDLGILLRAAALLPSLPFLVVLIGDGSERHALERLTRELGIDRHVRFLGHRDDARQWLDAYDIFVNSSISEGVSLTILEAMGAGLPVVATAVGGTPEVIAAGTGELVPPRSPAALADALARLGRDPEARRTLGAAARARVAARYTIERMVADYRDVYIAVT